MVRIEEAIRRPTLTTERQGSPLRLTTSMTAEGPAVVASLSPEAVSLAPGSAPSALAPGEAGAAATATEAAVPKPFSRQALIEAIKRLRPGVTFDLPLLGTLLDAKLADNKITREEFAEIFEVEVTKEFWVAFVDDKSKTDIKGTEEQFYDVLSQLEKSLGMTGDTLLEITHSKNIALIPLSDVTPIVRGMGLTKADLDKNPYLRDIYEEAKKQAMDTGGGDTGFEGLKDETWKLIACTLYSKFIVSGAMKKFDFSDIKDVRITEPWVKARFTKLLTRYAKEGSGPHINDLKELMSFQEKVVAFRAWARENGISDEMVDKFDVDKKEEGSDRLIIDKLLERRRLFSTAYSVEGKDWVVKLLAQGLRLVPAGG